jgi:hypothetical protein
MRFLGLIFILVGNSVQCQTIEQVQNKIDSLNSVVNELKRTIQSVEQDIERENNLIQTLKAGRFEKSLRITVAKPVNILDNRSIANGKTIFKVEKGGSVTLISFDGEYYYAESDGQTGYIYYPYLDDTRGLEEFKSFWRNRTKALRAREASEENRQKRDDRLERLTEKYGNEYARLIIANKLKMGMTSEMVIESIGRPKDKNVSHYSSGIHEQSVYIDKYVYLENGVLTAWQEER